MVSLTDGNRLAIEIHYFQIFQHPRRLTAITIHRYWQPFVFSILLKINRSLISSTVIVDWDHLNKEAKDLIDRVCIKNDAADMGVKLSHK